MEAQELCGGGISHASPPGVDNVASQFAETEDMPVTPTPIRWRSGNMMQPEFNEGSMESASMDENEGQEHWQTREFAETEDMPVTPTPIRWRSGNMMQPEFNEGSMESASMDENEGQEHWQTRGSSRTPSRAPSRASEARSGIRQRKSLQKTLIGRSKHQTSLLDVSKHAQVLVGALEAAQNQQQEMFQMVQEQKPRTLSNESNQ
ncbi:hypothetical protein SI65_05991 [Aspergillus cristatus]|uniref:Uncharacterized protein n=1 Tax=Aspergillus cristatus TaxID=573508 RepID=A0A1E3BEI5_ASPCR|nr:hypothetical protein SI65_05991 [Aspergillus cristatus]